MAGGEQTRYRNHEFQLRRQGHESCSSSLLCSVQGGQDKGVASDFSYVGHYSSHLKLQTPCKLAVAVAVAVATTVLSYCP